MIVLLGINKQYHSIVKSYIKLIITSLVLTLSIFISCAQKDQLELDILFEEKPSDTMDIFIDQVVGFWKSKNYDKAATLLRSIGRRDYSYYRMDEILYWLGKCNLALDDPPKANRCIRLLRKYYPRSENKFPDLPAIERLIDECLGSVGSEIHNNDNSTYTEQHADLEYAGPRVSNVYFETDIRQALTDISAQAGVSIVPDAMVQGYVTVEFTNVPLEQALQLLLAPVGFCYKKMEGYYLVGAPVADSPSFPLLVETERIKPKHLIASDVPGLLPDYYSKFLKVNPGTNTITISAPPDIIKLFKKELTAIDLPPQQIMIEALVVEMDLEASRSLGLDWDWTGTKNNAGFRIAKFVPSMMDSSFIAEFLKAGEHYQGSVFDLRMALRALAFKDRAHIRANPKVTTQDGHEAVIRIGRESYHSLVRGSMNYPYITLEKITTGILLKITPFIGSSSEIITEIEMQVSDVTGSGQDNLPVTSVRSVQTRVGVANAQTIGIGGLIAETSTNKTNRIPYLGDIPLLGYLFGNTTMEKKDTEVVVLITPHLLIHPGEFDLL
jgi:type II secretory pathway component HofQ